MENSLSPISETEDNFSPIASEEGKSIDRCDENSHLSQKTPMSGDDQIPSPKSVNSGTNVTEEVSMHSDGGSEAQGTNDENSQTNDPVENNDKDDENDAEQQDTNSKSQDYEESNMSDNAIDNVGGESKSKAEELSESKENAEIEEEKNRNAEIEEEKSRNAENSESKEGEKETQDDHDNEEVEEERHEENDNENEVSETPIGPLDGEENHSIERCDVNEKENLEMDVDQGDENKSNQEKDQNVLESDPTMPSATEADVPVSMETNESYQGDTIEIGDDDNQTEENIPEENEEPEEEDVCLLPDTEKELTGAEKEQAILARENAEKQAKEAELETQLDESAREDVVQRTPEEGLVEDDPVVHCIEDETETPDDNDSDVLAKDNVDEMEIKEIISPELPNEPCIQCEDSSLPKPCQYRVREEDTIKYLCSIKCVGSLRSSSEKEYKLTARKVNIVSILGIQNTCIQCDIEQLCNYRFRDVESTPSINEGDNEENRNTVKYHYLCNSPCMDAFVGKNLEKFLLKTKRYIVEEMLQELTEKCMHCKEEKSCKYSLSQDETKIYICNDDCFNLLSKEEPERYRLKRRLIRVRKLGMNDINSPQTDPEKKIVARTQAEADSYRVEREESFIRRCAECLSVMEIDEKCLVWETLDFCTELCLGKYQKVIGSQCTICKLPVPLPSLGKYCVRFGFDVKQFCRTPCLDQFKKSLKICSCCQKDISQIKEAFLAPVGNGGQFKDFCSQACMSFYDSKFAPQNVATAMCAVCNNEKAISAEIILDGKSHYLCSTPCFSAFKFVNNVFPDQCGNCLRYFERKMSENYTIYNENDEPLVFCCKVCMNIYITANRKIVSCQWCKVKKYNFDMIQKRYRNSDHKVMLCSINCLTLYGVSISAISLKRQKCDECGQQKQAQYHLTMSDTSIRNFCSYQCVMIFQGQFDRPPFTIEGDPNCNLPATNSRTGRLPFPTGEPKRITTKSSKIISSGTLTINNTSAPSIPVISSVTSLANTVNDKSKRKARSQSNQQVRFADVGPLEDDMPLLTLLSSGKNTRRKGGKAQDVNTTPARPVQKKTIGINTTETFKASKTRVLTLPPIPTPVFNKQTLCKPAISSKSTLCRPITNDAESQTTDDIAMKIPIPIPVPIYVPQPMYMYSLPFPCPVPIPLPIPVPIFIPTTRKSADGIMKEIKKIQEKMPTDPYEAELLMMAEMVAGEKKEESESESEPETTNGNSYQQQHHTTDQNNSFGEDVLQMALKMATECDEPAVDLESAMTTSTIDQTSTTHMPMDNHHIADITPDHNVLMMEVRPRGGRGRKRNSTAMNISNVPPTNNNRGALNAAVASITQVTTPPNKRARKTEQLLTTPAVIPQQQISPQKEITEKPDANMFLKYTFGVNAWKQWVMSKNAELERSSIRRRPFKTELLQLTADELNYSLCLFVKEVRKPNGSEYAPDTIYYLVLGIQQYLYENGRIDNIFTDPYYERFTDCLDEVARKFSILYNDSQFIVTRVEEEHLWECKQLGAHSPHVLLSTLMFFNTKYFNLTTVEEHMQLSFSHIMKHWKRNAPGARGSGNRNVLLRFYPPQTVVGQNPKKKKVYEQVENEEDPLRCPVKLYEFYLSKCPESVKTRNDVFYLQPERSCVPDSPVWYSTQALSEESLSKMLHRVKMVKEINIAILTS